MVGAYPLLPQGAFPGLGTLIGLRRPGSCFPLITTELQDLGQGTAPPCCAVAITVGQWDGERLGYRLSGPHPGPDLCGDAVTWKTSAPPVVGDPQEAGHSPGLSLALEGVRGGTVTLLRAGL